MIRALVNRRIIFFGFLTWLIPFILSSFFFSRSGQPLISMGLLKSLMMVAGSTVGVWLFVRSFNHVTPTIQLGLAIGLLWLGINLGLDLLVLVPMSKMTIPIYFEEIGLRYLVIPVMGAAFGSLASGHLEST